MATLARRIAPAAVLGGVAVALVGILDPALAGTGNATASEPTTGQPADSTGTSSAPATCDNAEQVQGPASMTPWGPVQVEASVIDGRLCEVHAVAYPMGDGHSQRINTVAVPTLDAMASQVGVAFDGVSGATYTTNAYRDSLQQLLDSLG